MFAIKIYGNRDFVKVITKCDQNKARLAVERRENFIGLAKTRQAEPFWWVAAVAVLLGG